MKQRCFVIPKSENAGIYMLYNMNNNKVYIGKTINFRKRAITHSSQLLNNSHINKEVQNDFNKGMEFYFVILENVGENCGKEELKELEMLYIYTFRNKNMKLYNAETNEQIKDLLFYEAFSYKSDRIRKHFRNNFGCPIPMLKQCSIVKLKEKLFLSE